AAAGPRRDTEKKITRPMTATTASTRYKVSIETQRSLSHVLNQPASERPARARLSAHATHAAHALHATHAFHHLHQAAALHLLHHVAHLLELVQEAVDVLHLDARALGDAELALGLQ